ncbi:MAG: hypothetical protein JWQ27_2831 [Ferruginibacter sp.]|nr:hypothetical protein [Ferruginibacter sp.]
MNLLKKLYYNSCSLLPLPLLQKISPATTLLPYHHTVSDKVLPHISELYAYKNVKQFTEDLDFLLKYYKPVYPEVLLDCINTQNRLPEKSFLLTFDDGFREVFDIIAPILEAKAVPAIFFINPAFIDNKQLFFRSKASLLIHELKKDPQPAMLSACAAHLQLKDPTLENVVSAIKQISQSKSFILDNIAGNINFSYADYLQQQQPFLRFEQLQQLQQRGFTIGAHSWDHPYYQQLNEQQQLDQTLHSCAYVRDKLHAEHNFFSFPYSDQSLPQQLFDKLVLTDVDLFFGIQNQKDELHNKMVHRFNAERPDISLQKQLKGMLTFMSVQQFRSKNKVHRF